MEAKEQFLSGWRPQDIERIFKEYGKVRQNFIKCLRRAVPYSPKTADVDIMSGIKAVWEKMKTN